MIEMFRGTGYFPPGSAEVAELMKHRERQLAALLVKARRDDELAREMRVLDEDIAAGIEELERIEAEKVRD
jgi:hypothetical protein